MKQNLLKFFAILLLPVVLLCGCSSKNKSKLETIKLSTYFEDKVVCTTFGKSSTTTISMSDITSEEPKYNLLGQYVEFEVEAKSSWIYKMYIDYVYFKVYTNMDVATGMTVNLSMTNLADEDNLQKPTNDYTQDCSFTPAKDGSFNCWYKIGKVVPTASGSTLTIDIINTTEVFSDEFGKANGFKWIIYDLKFYAESRTYSK